MYAAIVLSGLTGWLINAGFARSKTASCFGRLRAPRRGGR